VSDLIETHKSLLSRWRSSMNLIGPGDVQEHFDDCRMALSWVQPTGHWVDLGSGAGFPGIPFAASHPDVRVDLVDSRRKRCVFLDQVLGTAGISPDRVAVHCMRVEQLTGPYDGVISRAFAQPPAVLKHGARLLNPGGQMVLFMQAEASVPEHPDYELFHVEHYALGAKCRKAVGLCWRG
jgi:16S rRNA (guanine527-N7)-methyltransferase